MFPHHVSCEECNESATVRGYGRLEYDWPDTGQPASDNSTVVPTIRSVRLTVDCPHCGVRVQDHYPNGRPSDANPASAREALLRLKALTAAFRSRAVR